MGLHSGCRESEVLLGSAIIKPNLLIQLVRVGVPNPFSLSEKFRPALYDRMLQRDHSGKLRSKS